MYMYMDCNCLYSIMYVAEIYFADLADGGLELLNYDYIEKEIILIIRFFDRDFI